MIGQDILSWFYINKEGQVLFFESQNLGGLDNNGFAWGGELRNNHPSWSIGLEIWFYLLAPFFSKWKTSILVVICITSILLKIILGQEVLNPNLLLI